MAPDAEECPALLSGIANEVASGVTEVLAYGTAVVVEPSGRV